MSCCSLRLFLVLSGMLLCAAGWFTAIAGVANFHLGAQDVGLVWGAIFMHGVIFTGLMLSAFLHRGDIPVRELRMLVFLMAILVPVEIFALDATVVATPMHAMPMHTCTTAQKAAIAGFVIMVLQSIGSGCALAMMGDAEGAQMPKQSSWQFSAA